MGSGIDWKRTLIMVMFIYFVYSVISNMSSHFEAQLLLLPGLILALTVHEYSHARMADRLGDPTPENQGRITLSPLAHLDVVGTICLFFAGFGWGKPVQINPTYFRNPSRDNMLVALAGPVSNFILSFILFLIFPFLALYLPESYLSELLIKMVISGAYINLSLGVFNLLPFPPLDGSKILVYFLKGNAKKFIYTLEKYSYLIIMILFVSDLPNILISPVIEWISNGMLFVVKKIIMPFV